MAVIASLFFAYLLFRQIVRVLGAAQMPSLDHMSAVWVLGGIACAVGIFLEVKCTLERIVLALVVLESIAALVSMLAKPPLFLTEYRFLSILTRFICMVITAYLAFHPHRDKSPNGNLA